jgi:hypothetical protein
MSMEGDVPLNRELITPGALSEAPELTKVYETPPLESGASVGAGVGSEGRVASSRGCLVRSNPAMSARAWGARQA